MSFMTEAKTRSYFTIIMLILAGESVFILPFVLARIFRPTFLDVFGIDNLELGLCFSVYGIVALISYLFGGAPADRFHPRILMAIALIMTALGGFYMATYPSYDNLKILFGYYGFTTIFLFWAPMIKATRIWGGAKMQGRAFGYLDGGRGLVAALFGTLGVFIFSIFTTSELEVASFPERQAAFSNVIMASSTIILLVGIATYFVLKNLDTKNYPEYEKRLFTFSGIKSVLKLPAVWLLMLIILCAYVGYKLTDDVSLYANEVMGYDEVNSAKIGTSLLYFRPVIGIIIGLLADKSKASLWLMIGFGITLLSSLMFSSGILIDSQVSLFIFSTVLMAIGVYSARVLYFAVLGEGGIPLELTGTAVGVISVVGYTPDIFVGPVMGYFLDNNPGIYGHQLVFIFLTVFAVIGLISAFLFYRLSKNVNENLVA